MQLVRWVALTATLAACGETVDISKHDAAPADQAVAGDTMGDGVTCATVPAGQRAWWRGEQNAMDSVSNYHGVAMGTNFSYTQGRHGFAFQLDGSDDLVTISDNDAMWPAGSFSLEAWVKTTATQGNMISKYQCGGSCPNTVSTAYFGLSIGGPNAFFEFRTDADQNITAITAAAATVNDGQWHHVVGVRDVAASQAILYVDGQLGASSNLVAVQKGAMTNADNETDPVVIGAAATAGVANSFGGFLAGAVDDVAIYHSALTAAEVAAIYAAPDGKCL